MCRNIRPLFNFDPPATEKEIHDASLQFVRKITGFQKPSNINEIIFNRAVDEVAHVCSDLLLQLKTEAPMKNREEEYAKAKLRFTKRMIRDTGIGNVM